VGLFLTEGKIGVLSMYSLFLTRLGVYVGVCVCIRAHTRTLHRLSGVLGCEPRSRDETPGGPKESGWNKSRHIYIRMCVQSTHVRMFLKEHSCIDPQSGGTNTSNHHQNYC